MKYKVFIGSSSEHLDYAESVQLNIEKIHDIEVVCWNQGIFTPGNYPLEDLLDNLGKMSFGIFVLAPDDFIKIRENDYYTVRDNVLFEMGMFYGALGRKRTFFIVPKNTADTFRIPSDLDGINYARYIWESTGENFDQRVGSACTQIKRKIKEELKNIVPRDAIEKYGIFPELDKCYGDLFLGAKRISTAFIHSRRWRESNISNIKNFFLKKEVQWDFFLPNIENKKLMDMIKINFSDGKTMLSKIIDAYMFCLEYLEKYEDKISVYLFSFYPTYSFYKFDNKMVVSFYPFTSERRATPTLLIDLNIEVNDFFKQEIESIQTMSKIVSKEEIKNVIDKMVI